MKISLGILFCVALLMPLSVFAQQEEQLNYESVYESGIPFGIFLDQAERRIEMWHTNFGKGVVPESLQHRLDALQSTFYLLAVAVDGCSDSVNTIPYLAHLANASEYIEMKIVSPEVGREIMEANRTPDNRAATPTVVVLDSKYNQIGVFIERPSELQNWALGEGKELDSSSFMTAKFAWYDQDAGIQTMSEVMDLIEMDHK